MQKQRQNKLSKLKTAHWGAINSSKCWALKIVRVNFDKMPKVLYTAALQSHFASKKPNQQ